MHTFTWHCAGFCSFCRAALLIISTDDANAGNTGFLGVIRSSRYGNRRHGNSGFLFLRLAATSLLQ